MSPERIKASIQVVDYRQISIMYQMPRVFLYNLFLLDKPTECYCFRIEFPASAVGGKTVGNATIYSQLVRHGEDFSERLVLLSVAV